jgi:hypothetical protein
MAFESTGRRLRPSTQTNTTRTPGANKTAFGEWTYNVYPSDNLTAKIVTTKLLSKAREDRTVVPELTNTVTIDLNANINTNSGVLASVNPQDPGNITLLAFNKINSNTTGINKPYAGFRAYGELFVYQYNTETATVANITPQRQWFATKSDPKLPDDPANIIYATNLGEKEPTIEDFHPTPINRQFPGTNVQYLSYNGYGNGGLKLTYDYDTNYAEFTYFGVPGTFQPGGSNSIVKINSFYSGVVQETYFNWDTAANSAMYVDFFGTGGYGGHIFRKFAYKEVNTTDPTTRLKVVAQHPHTRKLYAIPGAGCSKNSQVDPANVDTTQKIIAVGNRIDLVSELDFSATYDMSPPGSTDIERGIYTWFRTANFGVDGKLYCFRDDTSLDANITVLDVDNVTLDISSTFDIYNTDGANSIVWGEQTFLYPDGMLRTIATGTQGALSGNLLVTIDTNPESGTYRQGRVESIDLIAPYPGSFGEPAYIFAENHDLYAFEKQAPNTNSPNVTFGCKRYVFSGGGNADQNLLNMSAPLSRTVIWR